MADGPRNAKHSAKFPRIINFTVQNHRCESSLSFRLLDSLEAPMTPRTKVIKSSFHSVSSILIRQTPSQLIG